MGRDKTHLEKLAFEQRRNMIYGDNDATIRKILSMGGVAAIRGANGLIFAQTASRSYIGHVLTIESPHGNSTVIPQTSGTSGVTGEFITQVINGKETITPNPDLVSRLTSASEALGATPFFVIERTFCKKAKVYDVHTMKSIQILL